MTQWINGQWLSGQGESLQKHNPVNGDLLWEGVAANALQVEQACIAARSAFPAWAGSGFTKGEGTVERVERKIG